jgi:hypothetical protein
MLLDLDILMHGVYVLPVINFVGISWFMVWFITAGTIAAAT